MILYGIVSLRILRFSGGFRKQRNQFFNRMNRGHFLLNLPEAVSRVDKFASRYDRRIIVALNIAHIIIGFQFVSFGDQPDVFAFGS